MDNTKLFNTFTSNLQKTMSSDIFGAKTQYQEKNGLAQKIAYAQWINDYASEIYYTAEDPRERANAKLLADSIHEQMPGVSDRYIIDNYENIIHRATGNKLNATGLMDVFGQKIAEGYKSFWAGVNAIAYTIEDSFKEYSESDEQKRLRQERQNAYLSSISGKVRTDYYNEYDNFVQKAILGLGDTLPSLLNSAPAFIGAAATSATGVPLFYAVGKGVSDTLNFTMEFGSLVQTLRETNATPEQILSASLLYAGISTAIEHNFDKIPENLLARPAGEFLQLYHAQKGLGVKAVTESARKVYGSVGKAVAGQFIKAGTNWASETGEEVLQQLAEDLTVNLLSDYREQHGQDALPDYVTHTPKEIGDDLVKTFKQMGTTQTLISTLTALGGLGFDASFGSIRQLVNSNKYTSKTQNSYMKLSSDVMGIKSDMNADKDNPFTPVRGKQTSIGYLPADINNARKAGAIRQADTDKKGNLGRLSAMQVEDSDDFVEKDKADKNKAVYAVSTMPDKNPIRIAVADDGTIVVPKNKIGGIVRDFIVRNYDKYNGIRETSNGDIQSFDVTIGDTTYSFTSDSNIEAESVTDKMTLQRMLSQKGDKISYIKDDFRKNLTSLFEKRGIKGDELNKTVDDFYELAERLAPTAQNIAQEISEKKNVDPDLAEQIAYGISGMVAEFKTIADIDSEWAKNHVVLADKLIDSENKTVGGKSVWTVGDQKYKNYLDIPVNQRNDATFNIAVSDMVNQTTGIHEIGHMALSLGEEKFISDDWFRNAFYDELKADNEGVDDERQWKIGDNTHEAFASKLETYIDTGVADSKEHASLFRRILRAAKAFFDKIYNSLSKDQLEFYDRLFDVTRDENVEISTDSAENSQNMAENAENQENISESEDDTDIEDYYEDNSNYGFDDDADVPDYDEYGDYYRYQKIIDRKDFQEFELESVDQRLEQGKMIPSPQLTRYKDKSDWARAEQRAETIYNDGELVWMSELLKSIVQEVKGDLVLYDQISDSDWALIEKAFVKRGDEKVGSMYRTLRDKAYSAYREDGKVAEKTTDFFNGNDVDKVLKRLYVNNLFYSQDDQVNAWLNKFTGKDADAGKRNAKWLAMKLRDLGIFDRDKVTIDGLNVSQRFRFLDTLLQTMYTGPEDRHYDYTRAGRAVWMGAQQEILKNAAYLMAIDQNYTERAEGGVRKSGVEDTGVAPKYQSFAEKDIRKSYEDKINAENELAQKEEELANVLAYAEDIRKERDDTVAELKKVAEKYNIDTEGMYRVEQVADAIRKSDEKIAKENDKILKKADDVRKKLDDANDKVRQVRSDMRIAERTTRELEVQNRQSARNIERLSKEVVELTGEIKELKAENRINKKTAKEATKKLDDALLALDKLRASDKALKENYAKSSKELMKAKKQLEIKEDANLRLTAQTKLDDAVIRQLDLNLTKVLDALSEEIKRKERYARALWSRNEQIEDMKVRRLIEHSKRNWKEMLERKSGDATTDKALRMISRAFFQRHSTNMVNQKNAHPFKALDIKGNPDLYNAINRDGVLYDSNNVGRTVTNLYSILEREGLIVDGKLVKGFSDLNLSAYKEVADAIRVARNQSNSASNERIEQRKNLVRDLSAEVVGEIDQLGLSKADRDEARKRFLNGEFETEQMAMLKVWDEKKPYLHEGTQAQKKRKKSINYGKTFNANNNIAFNSFTSGYNLLGAISPKLQELFFFGSDNMEGINKVTDNYLKRVAERKQIAEDAVTKFYNGDKKAVQKFMKDSQKTFVTEQYDGSPAWLANSQTWNNFRNTQEYKDGFSDDSLTLAEIIGIYEHSKQEEDLAHILNERTNITARQVAYIVNEFEKEDGKFHQYKEVADAYQHAYEKAWDRFQKVANDVYDMALTHYDFYSPARTAENETDIGIYYDFDANGNPNTYGKKMTMAERADMQMKTGGNNPITLDYITGFNNIIRSQEWFINAAEFFKTWNDIMKNDGGGVRRMIDDSIGSGASDTVMKWMRSVANSEFDDIASGLNKYMDAIRNHMALANLGFSVSSTFQQPSVMFLAASKYGYRKMFSALSQIKSHGGLKAFREYVHGKSLQIKSSADANIAYAKQAISDSKFLKAVGIAQDIAEIGMRGIEYTDQICRCITWEMGYEYYLEKGYSEDEANMRATQDTMNMNSSRQAKDNSLVYNSKNPLWKGLLMFTNQLNKQWNMLIGEDGVKALFNGNVKRFVSTVMGLGLATTWVLLAKGKLFNSDDDERWWEDLWVDYLGEGISVVPVIGDKISSVINGYSYLDSDLVTSMSNFIRQVAAEDKGKKGQKVTTATKNMLVDFTELIGAPKVVFKNTYNALFENGKWVGDEYFTSGRYLRQLLPYEWYQFVTGDK